jgi:adenylate kinase
MDTQTFVFFGQAGSGKGTQIKLLVDFLKKKDGREVLSVSTGEGFRELAKSGNFTSKIVKEKMERGELVPDFLTTTIFTNMLSASLTPEKHLITDGYPRTVAQSESLDVMMKFFERNNIKVINIELSEKEAVKRNMLRGRADDTEESLKRRFNEHKNNVLPAMNYFKEKDGYEILSINGEQSVEEVHRDIIKALNL